MLQSFEKFHQTYDFYACLEPLWQSRTIETKLKVGNCIIAVKPAHPIIEGTMDIVEANWEKYAAEFPGDDRMSNFLRVIHRTFDSFTLGIKAHINQGQNADIVLPPVFFFAPYVYSQKLLPTLQERQLSIANHFWQNTWFDKKKAQSPLVIQRPKHIRNVIEKISHKIDFLNVINIVICVFNVSLLLLFLKNKKRLPT